VSGRHQLKIKVTDDENQFFVPFTIPIEIFPGNVTVVTVNPAPSISLVTYTVISSRSRKSESDPLLVVKAVPDATTIWLDGKSYGMLPLVLTSLVEGDHKVVMQKKGFKDVSMDIQIAKDKIIYVESKLYEFQLTL
jgi:hypothetical protein